MFASRRSTSSGTKRRFRPCGKPANAFEVAPGQITMMPSPRPRLPFVRLRFKPSPKESSRTIDSVPQAIAATVITIRLRLMPAVRRKSLQDQPASFASSLTSSDASTGRRLAAVRAGK